MGRLSRRTLIASACGAALPALVERAFPHPLVTSALSRGQATNLPSAERPNILFICSDQHAGAVVGANGHPIVKTPNLDRLAGMGTNFQSAYCGNPVCVPSRAGLMTGMFPSDVHSYCNSTPFDGHVPTWGNRLKDAGYDCWATGKLDLWKDRDFGFTEVDTVHEHSVDPDVDSLFRSPLCSRAQDRDNVNGSFHAGPHEDVARAERGIEFISAERKPDAHPWCAWIGFTEPHPPFRARAEYESFYPPQTMPLPQWPEGYLERRHPEIQMQACHSHFQLPIADDRKQRARAAYFGTITEMDKQIGRILDTLEKSGQIQQTIIVYSSDHGEMLGEHGLWLKSTLLDYASRVPLIMAGPGIPAGKVVRTPVAHVDLIATLMEMAGARTSGLRGQSLLPMLKGSSSAGPAFAYSESHSGGNSTGAFMIRQDQWKYIYFTASEPLLFDMSEPFGEMNNLAKDEKFAPVLEQMHAHLTSVVDPDTITFAAFHRQDQVLHELTQKRAKADFYQSVASRLGSIQGKLFTERYYGPALM